MVNFKEIYHFSRFQRGSNIFQGGGGVQLFPGGSNSLFPIETHITCDFPGGSGPPVPPLDPHLPGQDTNGKVTNSQLDITNESQEVRTIYEYITLVHPPQCFLMALSRGKRMLRG